MAAPASHKQMAALGWQRTDLRPWTKCGARWLHSSGWRLEHCGHPTALHSWALYCPAGGMVLLGAGGGGNPVFGTAWDSLAEAAAFVTAEGAQERWATWTDERWVTERNAALRKHERTTGRKVVRRG